MEITHEQIKLVYLVAKTVFKNDITLADGVKVVSHESGMNKGSARGYIEAFLKMMTGSEYKWTINAGATAYYLNSIYEEYGVKRLLSSISAVRKHLEYYEGKGKSSQPKIQKILKSYIGIISAKISNEEYIDNFNEKVTQPLSETEETRNTRLKSASKKPRQFEVKTKVYSRNPDVVAHALIRAKGICERCMQHAPFTKKRDNTPYLEVHHIVQLAHGGNDEVENAQALCPNCHRELHFGKKLRDGEDN